MKLFSLLTLLVFVSTSVSSFGDDLPLGIVKEKPKSGRFVKVEQGYMVPYKMRIPGSDVEFEMVPIEPGGFKMGSPDMEEGRDKNEGPRIDVKVKPFWIGKYEVTWKEYDEYMALDDRFKKFEAAKLRIVKDFKDVDAITAPSGLYEPDHTYEKGDGPNQPAVTMTQYAARQYTKWLSLTSGVFYRLPTGAEWEYACRAGTTTAYHFGNDPSKLGDYAWFAENSDDERKDVGTKKPNQWGLHDMHGSVAEWVIDTNIEGGYKIWEGKVMNAEDCIRWPKSLNDQIVRGGSFELDAEACRSASFMTTEEEDWKDYDPNIPLSPWWFTTEPATGVGMRLFRPLEEPKDRKAKEKFWGPDVQESIDVAEQRIKANGRGSLGIVGPDLPKAIEDLKKKKKK